MMSSSEIACVKTTKHDWKEIEKLNLFISIPVTDRQKNTRKQHKTRHCLNTNHKSHCMLTPVKGYVTTKSNSAKQGRQAGNTIMQLFTKIKILTPLTSCYIKLNRWKTLEKMNATPKMLRPQFIRIFEKCLNFCLTYWHCPKCSSEKNINF